MRTDWEALGARQEMEPSHVHLVATAVEESSDSNATQHVPCQGSAGVVLTWQA